MQPIFARASQGGGSGIGVITQLETAIVQSPDPEPGSDRKFTSVLLEYSNEEEKVMTFVKRFQGESIEFMTTS